MPKRVHFPTPSDADKLHLLEFVLLSAFSSLAPETQKCYASQARNYSLFCQAWGIDPFPLSATSLALYFCNYVQRGNSPNSIPSILSALNRVSAGFMFPEMAKSDKFLLDNVIAGLHRLKPSPPVEKAPITLDLLHQLASHIVVTDPLEGMFLVLAFTAHDALLRFSEFSVLKFSDIAIIDDDHIALTIQKSKTSLVPVVLYLRSYTPLCAVSLLRAYLLRHADFFHQFPSSYLFPIQFEGLPAQTPMTRYKFHLVLRSLLARSGVPDVHNNNYSGHSFRSGGATDLWRGKCRPLILKKQGRWLTDAAHIYIRDHLESLSDESAIAFQSVCNSLAEEYQQLT